MSNRALDGARAKIERSIHHLQDINAAVRKLFVHERDNAGPPAHKYDSDRQELIVFKPTTTPVDPTLSLMVGDCIHNARSGLDHLAFQLCVLNHAPQESISKISFPVFLTAKEFNNAVRRKVAPFISSAALAVIEKTQPYSAGGAGDQDIIWALSQLDIIDKHRLLIVTKTKLRVAEFTVTLPTGEVFSEKIESGPWKSSEAGAELIRFDLSRAIARPGKMHVDVATAMTVQIENTGLVCDGMELGPVLADCINYVSTTIDAFGAKFFGE